MGQAVEKLTGVPVQPQIQTVANIDSLTPSKSLVGELRVPAISAIGLVTIFLLVIAQSKFEDPNSIRIVTAISSVIALICGTALLGWWGYKILPRCAKELTNGHLSFFTTASLAIAIELGFFVERLTKFPVLSEPICLSALGISVIITALLISASVRDYFREILTQSNHLDAHSLAQYALIRLNDGKEQTISASAIQPGMVCVLKANNKVPCDGVIKVGSCIVKERRYAGLMHVRSRGPGQKLIAGSEIVLGQCEIECESTLSDGRATSFFDHFNKLADISKEDSRSLFERERLVNAVVLFIGACSTLAARELGISVSNALVIFTGFCLLSIPAELPWILHLIPRRALRSAYDSAMLVKNLDVFAKIRACPHLAIDFTLNRPPGTFRVTELKLIDTRIEKSRLESALHAIFCACDDELAEAFSEYLARSGGHPVPCIAEQVREYPGLGISAAVEGAEFSVGNEEFLLERGVPIDPGETVRVKSTQQAAYVAIEDDVVACFTMSDPFLVDGREMKDKLQGQGVATWLWSSAKQSKVDALAKEAGFELGRVSGDLSQEQMQQKIEDLGLIAFYAHPGSPKAILQKSHVSIAHFDELQWDIDRADVMLMGRELWPIVQVFSLARSARNLAIELVGFGAAIAILVSALTVTTGLSPVIVSVTMMCSVSYLYARAANSLNFRS